MNYHVDGVMPDDTLQPDPEAVSPFYIFDIERQQHLPGTFKSRVAAEIAATGLNAAREADRLATPPLEKFYVRVGRDARIHYTAMIEAEDIAALRKKCKRYGFDAPEGTLWVEDGVTEFDDVETIEVWPEGDHPPTLIYEGR